MSPLPARSSALRTERLPARSSALRTERPRRIAVAAALAATLASGAAHAVDLPSVGGSPVKLDITETSIVAQRFEQRDGERAEDQGYFAWLNRLNMVLGWKHWTLGTRIDSSVYALRPQD